MTVKHFSGPAQKEDWLLSFKLPDFSNFAGERNPFAVEIDGIGARRKGQRIPLDGHSGRRCSSSSPDGRREFIYIFFSSSEVFLNS
jgi:hypothetical protein